jgi:type VI protein secretion system component Hcp
MGVFVKVEGPPIEGDSKFAKALNWIVCESCTIPTTRPETQTTMGKVTDRTRANVDFEDIQLKKPMDIASPKLMAWNLEGTGRTVMIRFTDETDWYMELELTNTILTKLDIDADAEGAATETLSLDFTKIKYGYRTKNPDGKGHTKPEYRSYDIAEGKIS